MDPLKEFMVGSTGIVSLLFYIIYFNLPDNIKTNKAVSNEKYAFMVPIYFGIMNVLMLALKRNFELTNMAAIPVTTLISSIIVFSAAYFNGIYNITGTNWLKYFIILFILHFVSFSIIGLFDSLLL